MTIRAGLHTILIGKVVCRAGVHKAGHSGSDGDDGVNIAILQRQLVNLADDLVEAISRLMLTEDECTGPINLGNNSEFTILELAEKVLSFTNSRSKLIFAPLPQDDPRQRQPDLSKAKAVLNWEPKVTLADGLKETIAYFKRSLELS